MLKAVLDKKEIVLVADKKDIIKPFWEEMINFENSPKLNSALVIGAYIFGWVYNLFLLDVKTFTFEFLGKLLAGIVTAVLIAFFVRLTNIFVDTKIKPLKFFQSKTKKAEAVEKEVS